MNKKEIAVKIVGTAKTLYGVNMFACWVCLIVCALGVLVTAKHYGREPWVYICSCGVLISIGQMLVCSAVKWLMMGFAEMLFEGAVKEYVKQDLGVEFYD